MYDFGGIDIVDTTSGVHAQRIFQIVFFSFCFMFIVVLFDITTCIAFNSGVDRVFIAGNKGLCVDKEGVLYFLALDF